MTTIKSLSCLVSYLIYWQQSHLIISEFISNFIQFIYLDCGEDCGAFSDGDDFLLLLLESFSPLALLCRLVGGPRFVLKLSVPFFLLLWQKVEKLKVAFPPNFGVSLSLREGGGVMFKLNVKIIIF